MTGGRIEGAEEGWGKVPGKMSLLLKSQRGRSHPSLFGNAAVCGCDARHCSATLWQRGEVTGGQKPSAEGGRGENRKNLYIFYDFSNHQTN